MSVVCAQQEKEGLVKDRYIERRILEKNTKEEKILMLSLSCRQVLWLWTGARDSKYLLKGNKNET